MLWLGGFELWLSKLLAKGKLVCVVGRVTLLLRKTPDSRENGLLILQSTYLLLASRKFM